MRMRSLLAPLALAALVVGCQDRSPTEPGETTRPVFHAQSGGTSASLSGYGTAVIDGDVVSGSLEWGFAAIRSLSGSFAGARLRVMNDHENLYLSLVAPDATPGDNDHFIVQFDNDHDGVFTIGDDWITVGRYQGSFNTTDGFYTAPWNVTGDTQVGGSYDLEWAMSLLDDRVIFELSHPLNGGDPYDISLGLDDTVGFCIEYVRDGLLVPESMFPQGCTGSQVDYGDIVISRGVDYFLHLMRIPLWQMVEDGVLTVGQTEGLHAKPWNAWGMYHDGRPANAIVQIEAYIHQVRGYMNGRILTAAQGDGLIAAAEDAMAAIQGASGQ